MKYVQEEIPFKPITITFETADEAHVFRNLVEKAWSEVPSGCAIDKLALELRTQMDNSRIFATGQ